MITKRTSSAKLMTTGRIRTYRKNEKDHLNRTNKTTFYYFKIIKTTAS